MRGISDDRDTLVRIRKLAHVAKRRMASHWVDYDAIESDAGLGYVTALRKWRPDGGASFWTYASLRMLSQIKDGVRGDVNRLHGASHKGYGPTEAPDDSEEPCSHPALLIDREPLIDARDEVEILLERLDSRQRELIERVHLRGERALDIARDWGITEGRVSVIGKRAFDRMRYLMDAGDR